MSQEEYVSFEQAESLKELGFPFISDYIYNKKRKRVYMLPGKGYLSDEVYPCPTLSLVQKWLREEKHVYLSVSPCGAFNDDNSATRYCFEFWKDSAWHHLCEFDTYETYEQALSCGIDKCINLIKENK